MDMNGQQPPQQDPQITYTDPKAYILYLKSRGLNAYQIDELVSKRFGPGKTPEQRQRDLASQQQRGALAGTAGQVGGVFLGAEAMRGFPNLGGLFSSGAGTSAVNPATIATEGSQAAWNAGALGTGAEAGAAEAGASTLGSVGSVALPIAVGALAVNNMWESGMKDIIRGRGTREDYTNWAANFIPFGGPANLALRLMGKRSIGKMMTTGKSDAQLLRDDFRGKLKETGVADDTYHVTLADGSKFNIGLDGKTKYKNVGENVDGKTTRNAWDVDHSNPLAMFAVNQIDPMIRNIYGEDAVKAGIKPEQYTGMLVNAATSNAKSQQDVLANIQAMLGKSIFAQQAGVGVTTPPPPKAPKGEVMRVSPGMYVNDKGHVGPAKTVREALQANYKGK